MKANSCNAVSFATSLAVLSQPISKGICGASEVGEHEGKHYCQRTIYVKAMRQPDQRDLSLFMLITLTDKLEDSIKKKSCISAGFFSYFLTICPP